MNKTIRKVGYAVLTESSTGEITYGKPVWFKSDKASRQRRLCLNRQ